MGYKIPLFYKIPFYIGELVRRPIAASEPVFFPREGIEKKKRGKRRKENEISGFTVQTEKTLRVLGLICMHVWVFLFHKFNNGSSSCHT